MRFKWHTLSNVFKELKLVENLAHSKWQQLSHSMTGSCFCIRYSNTSRLWSVMVVTKDTRGSRWALLGGLARLAGQACRAVPWQPARPLSSISTLLYTQHSCSSGGEDLSELLQHLL